MAGVGLTDISKFKCYKGNTLVVPHVGNGKIKQIYKGGKLIWEPYKFHLYYVWNFWGEVTGSGKKFTTIPMPFDGEVGFEVALPNYVKNYWPQTYLYSSLDNGNTWTQLMHWTERFIQSGEQYVQSTGTQKYYASDNATKEGNHINGEETITRFLGSLGHWQKGTIFGVTTWR